MKNLYLMIFLLVEIFFTVSLAQIQETKLVPTDGQVNDSFGSSIASDGNYLVVGAAFSSYNHPGYASLYEKIGEVWTEKSKLQASDGYPVQEFGRSVSISGNFILIGAYYDDQIGTEAGAAYVFKRDTVTGNWIEMQKLFASDSLDYAKFGYSVALLGDHAVIGAPRYFDSVETGAAYIFKWNDTAWVEEAKLVPVNGVGNSQGFGSSVSIFGDYAVIGAFNDKELDGWPGAAYIFYNNGSHWIQQARLHASDINLNHHFGWSVSIYEDYAAVGSYKAWSTTGGVVLIFHRNDTTWTEEAILEGSSSFSPIDFGYSVSLDGDYLIVGAPEEETNGNNAGCAYIFKRNGINWTEQTKLLASDGTEGDWMGWSVFIEDDEVFVGAPVQDAGDKYCGAVYVYTDFITGVNEINHNFVKDFSLKQNYPNPFNPSTEIRFAVREGGGYVELKIYDLLGREVKMLVNERKAPGSYTVQWSGTNDAGQPVASGVYIYKLNAEGLTLARKMLLIR